jgi:hypothetical protein
MTRLTKLGIGHRGILDTLARRLRDDWHPAALSTELAYSDALAAHLRALLPEDSRVEREYRHDGTTCDVCVRYRGMLSSDMVLIEVKRNLRRKSDYDRLVGQIEGLKPGKNSIILVLVGETDPALLGRLQDQFEDELDEDSDALRIVVVKQESPPPPSS